MKKRQSTRPVVKRNARPERSEAPASRPEERPAFGRRRPREIELDRTPARAQDRKEAKDGSLLGALVRRIFR